MSGETNKCPREKQPTRVNNRRRLRPYLSRGPTVFSIQLIRLLMLLEFLNFKSNSQIDNNPAIILTRDLEPFDAVFSRYLDQKKLLM